jgi:hypothetical protein
VKPSGSWIGAAPCSDPRCDSDKLESRATGLHVGGRWKKWLSCFSCLVMSKWVFRGFGCTSQFAGTAQSRRWMQTLNENGFCRALHSRARAVWNLGDAATPQASRRAEKSPQRLRVPRKPLARVLLACLATGGEWRE